MENKQDLSKLFPYIIEEGHSEIKGTRYFKLKFDDNPLEVSINVTYSCDCKDCGVMNHPWRCRFHRALFKWLSLSQRERNGYKPIKRLFK